MYFSEAVCDQLLADKSLLIPFTLVQRHIGFHQNVWPYVRHDESYGIICLEECRLYKSKTPLKYLVWFSNLNNCYYAVKNRRILAHSVCRRKVIWE